MLQALRNLRDLAEANLLIQIFATIIGIMIAGAILYLAIKALDWLELKSVMNDNGPEKEE